MCRETRYVRIKFFCALGIFSSLKLALKMLMIVLMPTCALSLYFFLSKIGAQKKNADEGRPDGATHEAGHC